MLGIALVVIIAAGALLPLFIYYCRRFGIRGFRQVLPRALVVYAVTAGSLAAVFAMSEWSKFTLEGLGVWASITGFGLLLFSPVFGLVVWFATWRLAE